MWTLFYKNENRVFGHISRQEQGSSPEILALRLCLITLGKRSGKPEEFIVQEGALAEFIRECRTFKRNPCTMVSQRE